ncbi:MAG: mannose-1-phosphate guanylyltransferase, partial [Bacteroidales bacterium]|nr:mannose-1-phosphate guanylyltransferase [Bacteroidales bacterium]
MNNNRYCVIMAGGSGRRFWPISREERPTQFLHVADMGRTLLDLTFERVAKIVPEENILVVTLEKYADAAREILPRLKPENLILEPYSR